MNAIVTILVKESAGILSTVVLNLSPKGYRLDSHKKMTAERGLERMKLFLRCPNSDLPQVERDVLSLGDNITIEKVELEGAPAAAEGGVGSGGSEKEVLSEIARSFPDVARIVRGYGKTLSAETRSRSLFDLGSKTGRAIYKRDFALGSPLKMPAAWRRVIVPALRDFGETKADDESVTLLNCPFCASGDDVSCCEFVTGFVSGLLDSGPYTQGRRVHEATCRSKGGGGCRFVIDS